MKQVTSLQSGHGESFEKFGFTQDDGTLVVESKTRAQDRFELWDAFNWQQVGTVPVPASNVVLSRASQLVYLDGVPDFIRVQDIESTKTTTISGLGGARIRYGNILRWTVCHVLHRGIF